MTKTTIGSAAFDCGFMSYNEFDNDAYLDRKISLLKSLFDSALALSLDSLEFTIYNSPAKHFRQRCRFAIIDERTNPSSSSGTPLFYHAMWDGGSPSIIVGSFPIASIQIYEIMPYMIRYLQESDRLSSSLKAVNYLSTTSGHLIVTLVYGSSIDGIDEEQWIKAATALKDKLLADKTEIPSIKSINIIGRSKGAKLVIGNDHVQEVMHVQDGRQLLYKQVETGFSNPNSHVNVKVLDWICENVEAINKERMARDSDGTTTDESIRTRVAQSSLDLLELYCGNGNHTIALSAYFRRILAVELNKTLCEAAEENLLLNKIDNVTIVPCDSEKFAMSILRRQSYFDPKDTSITYSFGAVLVDPPRSGLDSKTRGMVSRYDYIVYISCNPDALVRDLKEICVSHDVANIAAFDQFAYTPHLEVGVILRKKMTHAE